MAQFLVTVRSRLSSAAPHQLYLIDADMDAATIQRFTAELLHDPVVQDSAVSPLGALDDLALPEGAWGIEVAYLPGVTDNEAESIRIGAERLGLPVPHVVRTLRRYLAASPDAQAVLRDVCNPLVQTAVTLRGGADVLAQRAAFYAHLLQTPADTTPHIARVDMLDADDEELLRISREGILALDLEEMRAIQAFFRAEGRQPTDGELETLAQTWSEHCSHKTFKAKVRYSSAGDRTLPADAQRYPALAQLAQPGGVEIDSLIKTFLIKSTNEILATHTDPWILSVFVDNAGIVAFGPDHEVSIKVETHNHPSALEPFGGANTGVGGVIRDVMGVSAKPIANTDVLCFGPLALPEADLTSGVLHPRTVASGVVAGVRDYGNKLGIPTVNGAVLYEDGYTANPLVFCGTVGLAPRGSNPHRLQPGDAVVVLGGRTGRDGIHGATFSSVELTHTTAQDVGSAVQIGDPITEKKVLDVLLQARDRGLYSAITDCGAGGLSSAVGEMGAETGVRVILDDVPLKYAGLQPWEIWLSEAQERMVISVPQPHLPELLALCEAEDVEATVIGEFTGDGRLTVLHRGATVVDMAMAFVHDGRPQRQLAAEWATPAAPAAAPAPADLTQELKRLLAHPNIASKEPIIRTYDHEVGGRTVVKPLVGVERSGPGDAAVLRPLPASPEGFALASGINPRYGEVDPYWMALAVVDEALRNVVAVGGDPRRAAVLDNFCWGDPRLTDRMAGLVRAVAGCYDAALAYGTPFISGKDSLNNEYRGADGARHAIPPTLLITALAHVPDVAKSVTMDVKEAGNRIYAVGLTKDERLGGHSPAASDLPKVDLATAPALLAALHQAIQAGLVRSCHDLSEGGLAVAAAEMAFAGGLGLALDLAKAPASGPLAGEALLFSESPTRFLVEVRPQDAAAFEAALAGLPAADIGEAIAAGELRIVHGTAPLVQAPIAELQAAWQGTQVV